MGFHSLFSSLFVFVVIMLHNRGSYYGSDDSAYLEWAKRFSLSQNLEDYSPNQEATRVVLWISAWLVSALYGTSVYWGSVIAGTLFATVLIVSITHWWGGRFPPGVQILAGAIIATNVVFCIYAPTIYPEVYKTTFMVLALIQYRRCCKSPFSALNWLLVGLFIGFATLAKQDAILLFPIIVVHWLLVAGKLSDIKTSRRKYIFPVGLICLGGAIVIMVLIGFSFLVFSRPLFFFQVTGDIGGLMKSVPWHDLNKENYFAYLRYFSSRDFLYLGMLLPLSAIITCFSKKGPKLEAWIGLVILFYLSVGSASMTQYVPITKTPRYIFPVIPFFAVCLSYQVFSIWEKVKNYINSRHAVLLSAIFWTTVCCILFISTLITLDRLNKPWPMSSQRAFIQNIISIEDRPVFATKSFKNRFSPILSEQELDLIKPLDDSEIEIKRYAIMFHVDEMGYPEGKRIYAKHVKEEVKVGYPPTDWQPSWLQLLRAKLFGYVPRYSFEPPIQLIEAGSN